MTSSGQWRDLCLFQSSDPLKLLLRVFPKLPYHSFLSEFGQKFLHLESRTLTVQIDRVYTTPNFPVSSSCNRNFARQRYSRSCVLIRTSRVPAQILELALPDECDRPGLHDTFERQKTILLPKPVMRSRCRYRSRKYSLKSTYLALVRRNK